MNGLFKGNLRNQISKQVMYDHVEAQDVYIYFQVQRKEGKEQSVSLH